MKRFIEGEDRNQSTLFPELLDDYLRRITRCGLSMYLSMNWI